MSSAWDVEQIRRLAAVVANARDGITVTDMNGRIVLANRAAEQMTGRDQSNLVDAHLFDLHPGPSELPAGVDILASIQTHGAWAGETLLTNSDGEVVRVNLTSSVVRDDRDGPTGLVWTYREISDESEAGSAQSENDNRFSGVFDNAIVGMALLESDGRFTQVNDVICDLLGFPREQMLYLSFQDIAVSGESVDRSEDMAKLWSGASDGFNFRQGYYYRDGSVVWTNVSMAPVRDAQGTTESVLVQIQDVTELKHARDKLAAARKLGVVGQLAGGVAHDFNNVLTPILAYSSMLGMSIDEDDPNRAYAANIESAAERGAVLTRQLLTFARREPGEPQVFDLNEMITDMTKMLRRLIGEHIELAFAPSSEVAMVRIDPGQMEEILVNLAIDARDAMPLGGTVTIGTTDAEFDGEPSNDYAEAKTGNYIGLTVSDTRSNCGDSARGSGLSGEIGEPGLAAVYDIVTRAGGFAQWQFESGQAWKIEICLPTPSEEAIDEARKGAQKGEPPRGVEGVLVVDDEPAVRRLTADVLNGQGYRVMEAVTGHEALRIAEQNGSDDIDLVLTDIVMPQMSGRELAVQLREKYPRMKILFMSGYAGETTYAHGNFDMSIPFVAKPFTPGTIARKVREILDAA